LLGCMCYHKTQILDKVDSTLIYFKVLLPPHIQWLILDQLSHTMVASLLDRHVRA